MSGGADLPCPACAAPLKLNERSSRGAGKLIYDCRTCDRRYSLKPRQVELVEESYSDDGPTTQRMLAYRATPPPSERLTELQQPSVSSALPEGLTVTLDLTDGPQRGRSVKVTQSRTVIGREQGEVRIPDPLMSRRHVVLEIYDPDTILMKDLTSTNGTYHNGRLIDHCKLQDGDEVRIGSSIISVAIERSQA
jgi:pSer/pThr/pTyr-binding forkhead associated (FHA) protein